MMMEFQMEWEKKRQLNVLYFPQIEMWKCKVLSYREIKKIQSGFIEKDEIAWRYFQMLRGEQGNKEKDSE